MVYVGTLMTLQGVTALLKQPKSNHNLNKGVSESDHGGGRRWPLQRRLWQEVIWHELVVFVGVGREWFGFGFRLDQM